MNFNFSVRKFYGPETAAAGAASGGTPWGAIAQSAIGLGQFIAGAVQRKRAEKAAEAQIQKLGPDTGIMSYYNQALQRYGVSPTQSAMYKRQMQNIQRAAATGLAGAGGQRGRLGAASSVARSMSDAALGAEVAEEQQKAQQFGQLGAASQLAAAEKRRPEELRLQMALQKAAGGSQIANVGMSNIFGGLQSAATQKLYRDIYGVGGKGGSEFPRGYTKGASTGMLDLFETPSTSLGSVSRSSGLTPRATPSATLRRSYVPNIPSGNTYPGSIYPFPTYPY